MNTSDRNLERNEATWLTAIGLMLLYLIPYGIVNHLPLQRTTIPLMFGESLIPFLPWTFIIYISIFAQAIIAIHGLPYKTLRAMIPAMSGMVIFALALFIIFPIEYPRFLYETNSQLISLFHMTDGPGNCFPSLHVVVTVILGYVYRFKEKNSTKRTLMWLWSVLICISVLTTKQHYVIDIIGGVLLAVPGIYMIRRAVLQ